MMQRNILLEGAFSDFERILRDGGKIGSLVVLFPDSAVYLTVIHIGVPEKSAPASKFAERYDEIVVVGAVYDVAVEGGFLF
jgi:hypothetical protein